MDPDLDESLGRVTRLLQQREIDEGNARRALPCFGLDDEAAATACEAVTAHAACAFGTLAKGCHRARLVDGRETYRRRLVDGAVPEREREIILAAITREIPLQKTEPLTAVRRRIAWRENPKRQPTRDLFAGGGEEEILVLAGAFGVGKTLASCYAIGRMGGRYLRAAQLARPGLNVDALLELPVVVVDQLGRESPSSSYFLSQFEELLDGRYAAKRLTILCGNLLRAQFDDTYGPVVAERMKGGGAFVALVGESLRGKVAP